MQITLDTGSIESYRQFLRIKQLPRYRIRGHTAEFPDEYAGRLGIKVDRKAASGYVVPPFLFDYQAAITRMAINKQKFAGFIDCGWGKSLIMLEFAKHAQAEMGGRKNTLIVSPLMVIKQTMAEAKRFYNGSYQIEQIPAAKLGQWLNSGDGIGITNYEAITDELVTGRCGCICIDESSLLKSAYGKWGTKLIDLGKGLEWKLSMTGTPAPNDRIEYANQAVFLDQFPTVNSFLAKYFVNKGQTQERWILKPHALGPFYRALSHWSIFMTNPATYGWKDNCGVIPPIHAHIHNVDLTQEQHSIARAMTGDLFATASGGIASRSTLAQIAKGQHRGQRIDTHKPAFIRDIVDTWKDNESTLIWCRYNAEQERLKEIFPEAASISGNTPIEEREELIEAFKSGEIKTCLSKSKCMGMGLNLHVVTRQVFSTCQDSYEEYYQCVKRSNRVGSKLPLNVHLPVTDLERPMLENVLRKCALVQRDTEEQERIFKEYAEAL